MLERLVNAVTLLEREVQASPLHKMHASYLISAFKPDPTVANFLFRNRSHMEKARALESAYAADLISMEQFCEEFPNIPFVAINVHYEIDGSTVTDTFTSEGIMLIRRGLEKFVSEVTIELCIGAKVVYVPDDNKIIGDVIVGVSISHTGTVSNVYRTDYKPPFSFRRGTDVLEVFRRMETFVRTNGLRR